jgi:hypothetical protein
MDNQALTPTPASEWKGALNVEGTDLELPSDNVARVRQISPQAFLQSGMIPDPLRPISNQAINSKKGLPPTTMKKMMEDPKQVGAALELFDRTITYVVLEPKILMPPPCTECGELISGKVHGDDNADHDYNETARKPGVLYADQIDLTDKQFIFQWCMGGVRELEPFRQESPTVVGLVPDV